MNRRSLMRDTALFALTVALTTPRSVWANALAKAYPPAADGMVYEIRKSEAEWRARGLRSSGLFVTHEV